MQKKQNSFVRHGQTNVCSVRLRCVNHCRGYIRQHFVSIKVTAWLIDVSSHVIRHCLWSSPVTQVAQVKVSVTVIHYLIITQLSRLKSACRRSVMSPGSVGEQTITAALCDVYFISSKQMVLVSPSGWVLRADKTSNNSRQKQHRPQRGANVQFIHTLYHSCPSTLLFSSYIVFTLNPCGVFICLQAHCGIGIWKISCIACCF